MLMKTEKARQALARRDASLPVRARQLLVMCDGKRSRQDLLHFFGSDAHELLGRFVAEGYLLEPAAVAQAQASSPAQHRPRQTPASPAAKAMPSQTIADEGVRGRRSAAAVKMYMVGMMQLLRQPDAAALAVNLHTSTHASELMPAIRAAVEYLVQACGVEYAQRVQQRLLEIAPEDQLPDVRALADCWAAGPG